MTISLPKLILIIIVILAVWYVSRVLNRGGVRAGAAAAKRGGAAAPGQSARGQGAIEDLIPCRTCGAYVSPGAHNCGRPACPQPR